MIGTLALIAITLAIIAMRSEVILMDIMCFDWWSRSVAKNEAIWQGKVRPVSLRRGQLKLFEM